MESLCRIKAYMFTSTGTLGFIANIIQLVLINRDKKQKNSVFGLALLSLSIADLLASMSFVFRGSYLLGTTLNAIESNEDRVWDYPWAVGAIVFSLTSSFTHVVFIAVQRVIAVVFPLKVKQIITKSRSYFIITILWITSVALAVIVHINIKYGIFILTCIGVLVSITITALYPIIYFKIKKRVISCDANARMLRRRQQSEKKVLMYSVAITLVFVGCNYPKGVNLYVHYPMYLRIASDLLYSLNPLFDTLLYFLSSYCKRLRESSVTVPVEIAQKSFGQVTAEAVKQ